jgi:2-keto-4-pentenoate hydratase/2-oxohepta-3-ene-1,7-dioic acid hydratase in catechol pathway
MRLVTYDVDGQLTPGVQRDGRVLDVAHLLGDQASAPGTVRELLAAGPGVLGAVRDRAAAAGRRDGVGLDEVRLGPPVPDPDKIICLGLNYRDHAEEAGLELPAAPMLFAKFRNSLIGPQDPIVLPLRAGRVDYEAELAVVIGRRAKDVTESRALEHVAGVMALNDVSARDLQLQTSQWTAGKAIDTFAPCGPALVLLDEIDDVQALGVRARVNGRTVQDGTTSDMIFSVAATVAWVSQLMTLEPGDVIATGTPAGVGFTRKPPVLLQPGDVVEVDVDRVGSLRNPVVAARPADERDMRDQAAVAG